METRLKWLSAYFLFIGAVSGLRAISIILLDDGTIIGEVLINLIFASAYLYCGLHLKTLLLKWKRAIQILVAFTICSNIFVIYFGADISTGFLETDTLGRILSVLIFAIPISLCGYIMYQIEALSKQLEQPVIETPFPPVSNPLLHLEKRFYAHKYFLLSVPSIVALVSQVISAIVLYLPLSNEASEKIIIYAFYGVIAFACLYLSFTLYWLLKKRFLQAIFTFLGLCIGVAFEYVISVYAFIYLP